MAFDAICLRAVLDEIREALDGAKIDKIQQPERDALVFSLRGRSGSHRLLLSAAPGGPRIQLTRVARENPAAPPMFCMLLRKYLIGARVTALSQPGGDRVAALELLCTDELGDAARRTLVVELMGRYSNIMLLDAEGRIVDCLKRVDAEMSPTRQVLPGLFYHPPSTQGKLGLEESDETAVRAALAAAPPELPAEKRLLGAFAWLSPLWCREAALNAGEDDGEALAREVLRLRELILAGEVRPTMLLERRRDEEGRESEQFADFTWQEPRQYGAARRCEKYPSFSALMDDFYEARESAQHLRQQGQGIFKTVNNARDRLIRKLALQRQELLQASDREALRHRGDLIMANLWKLEKGQEKVMVTDYTQPAHEETGYPEVEIRLDPRHSPQQNAQNYYKQYAKRRHAEEMLRQMIAGGERELEYLDSVLDALQRSTRAAELAEIRTELWQNGYASQKWAAKTGRMKEKPLPPLTYVSRAGLRILAGRNNRQNEELTFRTASRSDWWFHVQKAQGAHVVLLCDGKEPDEDSLTDAALVAACHSAAGRSRNVAVDYTQARSVRRQPEGKTGMVFYTNYKTAYVTPDEDALARLRVK